ncbi:Swarming motility protein SwrAA [Bacillus sp. IB182487]|uniref:Swarming motility protein SwrAA n=2 Tax=Metabacillus arenae TaxID=2771434 RepID=A0A926NI10_9BACI|nr:Swarming motility protein SwrAA [Metabacillus arenae]
MREETYRHLLEQFKMYTGPSTYSNAKIQKWLQLFCMYLANYTSVKNIAEVDKDLVEEYFHYLTNNWKRLSLNLTDIKRSMQLIEELLEIKLHPSLLDFSLSNTNLWQNLNK